VEYFFTQERYEAMLRLRRTGQTALSEDVVVKMKATEQDGSGTVGAVALDQHGNLAASTSSGGTANKYAGRVGQAAIVGAGVYAYNRTCAISCTGFGEAFMRLSAAHEVSALMEHRGLELAEATATVIGRLPEVQGRGGMIGVDGLGRVALPYNTEGMYRGWIGPDGLANTAIYAETRQWPVISR
jgi:beta-aspartyl-peptidase (threonine type)